MSQYNQNQVPTAYPATAARGGVEMVVPPPAGYPTREMELGESKAVAVETKSRGDGFWKGCCAALCCCCVLDACF